MFNYSKTIVHLQADLNRLPAIKDINSFIIRELNVDNAEDIQHWLNIVNDAYVETEHDREYALNHINNHLFLNIYKIYLLFDKDKPIGTISIGTFKSNKNMGGDARIAIRKDYQGKGLGSYLLAYGFQKLKESGIKYGESIISITREQSIMLHFKCGFIPQYNKDYISYKGQRRHFLIRFFVREQLNKMYRIFLGESF